MESYAVNQKILKLLNECESLEEKAQFLQSIIKKCASMLDILNRKNTIPYVEVIEPEKKEIHVENKV